MNSFDNDKIIKINNWKSKVNGKIKKKQNKKKDT